MWRMFVLFTWCSSKDWTARVITSVVITGVDVREVTVMRHDYSDQVDMFVQSSDHHLDGSRPLHGRRMLLIGSGSAWSVILSLVLHMPRVMSSEEFDGYIFSSEQFLLVLFSVMS
ncbi:hypothetical protein BgiBS90_017155 [Biomphalaria glabrata]|nr:hypothetical protein BgiBS90_017155 [Biomphalaria glabrata]